MSKCEVMEFNGEKIIKIRGGNLVRFDELRTVIEGLLHIEATCAQQDKESHRAQIINTPNDAITCVNEKCGWNYKGWCGLVRVCPGRNK